MWQYTHTDELYHWGVKGMKWGVRKKRDTSGDNSSSTSGKAKVTAEEALQELKNYKKQQRIKSVVRTGLTIGAIAGAGTLIVKGAGAIGGLLGDIGDLAWSVGNLFDSFIMV